MPSTHLSPGQQLSLANPVSTSPADRAPAEDTAVSRPELPASPGLPSRLVQRGAEHPGRLLPLAFGALGIVYGDIGTSPLYAFRESFEHADLAVSQANAYGVASVVFWALIVIISIKYLLLVMRADNHGEGGILALTALLMPTRGLPVGTKRVIIALGVFGTALLYGDGLITPAISVLSAVEGFEVATTAFESWVIPVSVAILIVLFAVQRRGTETISRVFGPVMVVWFVVLGVLGLRPDHRQHRRAAGRLADLRRRAVRQRAGQGVPGARFDLPRRHRRRGPVRRHGPLRSSTHPDSPGTRWSCRRCC